MIQLLKSLVLLVLLKQHASHQDVAFDVVWIFPKNFLRESFGFTDDVCSASGAGEIVVTEFDARVEIVLV